MTKVARRLASVPPYPFAKLEMAASDAIAHGRDVVNLGIGDPDLPPPPAVVEVVGDALRRPEMRGYGASAGERFFREAVADWYAGRFGVDVDPDREVCCLIGSKEGIVNVARAFVDPGARVLCPDPGYPVYTAGATLLCDGEPEASPLPPPDHLLDPESLADVRLAFMNYPNNPTGAVATRRHLESCVERALERGIVLCQDFAYSELAYDQADAPSILAIDGGMECAVELHSFSKTFSMTSFRLGMAVGNADAIAALKRVKTQVDSGPPKFLQCAGAVALGLYRGSSPPREVRGARETYRRRMEVLVNGLKRLGHDVRMPRATFYLWQRVEGDGLAFVERLLGKNVLITPGGAFGEEGRGYVRWAVTQPEERIRTALEMMEA